MGEKMTRLLRLPDIIGNPNSDPPIPPRIPVSRSTWWSGVKSGRFPQPVKLGPKTTTWKENEIDDIIEQGVA